MLPWLLSLLGATGSAALYGDKLERDTRLAADLSKVREERHAVDERLAKAEEQLASARKQVTDAQSTKKAHEADQKIIADLRSKIGKDDGDVSAEDANHITLNLVDRILFKSGDASLSKGGQTVLAKVATVLKDLPEKQILIGGHTDNVPIHNEQYPSNWELSTARAVTVVHYLIETGGVDPKKVAAAGYAEFHPRKKSRMKNRRIEILLTPSVEIKREPIKKEVAALTTK